MKNKTKMGDVVINMDDELISGAISLCRICHEQEFESLKSLETPCACSGTVKFAHRDCIQRWCNEKGNTTCEICLQKFESGFYVPSPKKVYLVDNTAVTIRGSLEVIRRSEAEPESSAEEEEEEILESQCSQTRDRNYSYCRTALLIFTIVLLMRHVLMVLNGGAKDYPFTLPTLILIKASGIILPMYIIIMMITKIQNANEGCSRVDSEDIISNADEDN
ncbi:PREDICTED: E3 ubiquitin-protein ligase MARCH8-like [Nicotiana attenuata]|uniref:RING-CH-type domain-containing protein n=1 Tax=Nicotiana attenuata TaxID=49451 RepID=A0A1J6IP70_NICAT|nr:PREDICTED: E3 ubiquitin-protein ligase MARCH8-like [Nicotiana attenuata]OIT06965.1 hypothetical protein A4A49_18382 [Nicotiana attenuata]